MGFEAFRVGSAYLAIADRGDVVFVSQVAPHNPIRAFFRPGTRGFMHASGIGKALLANMSHDEVEKIPQKKGCPEFTPRTLTSPTELFADLARIRQLGWALDAEERYTGMRCIAAPIYNSHSEATAGVSVSGPAVRFPDKEVLDIAPRVKRAADEITKLTGGTIP